MSEDSTRSLVANVLHCEFVVNEFEPATRYHSHFWTNTLGKDMNHLIPQQLVLQRGLSALNNPQRLIFLEKKETKNKKEI